MGLLRDLRKAGITASMIIEAVKAKKAKQDSILRIGPEPAALKAGFVVTWVKVDGASSGGGVYTGRYLVTAPEQEDLDKSASVAEAIAGTFGSGTNDNDAASCRCYVFNFAEMGASTHDLTAGSQSITVFPALYLGHEKSDGLPCFGINGFDIVNCS